MKDVMISIRIPGTVVEGLRKIAKEEDRPVAYVIRKMIVEALAQRVKK